MVRKIILTVFFFIYACVMFYEGVLKDFSHNNLLWIGLFVLSAVITYWTHKNTSIIVIGFLMIHTTLEMLHHGAEYQMLGLIGGCILAIHFVFDSIFLWIEMRHHIPKILLGKSFALALTLYAGALCIGIFFGNDNTLLGEGVEKLNGIIAGTIFGCVMAHAIGMIKKIKTGR